MMITGASKTSANRLIRRRVWVTVRSLLCAMSLFGTVGCNILGLGKKDIPEPPRPSTRQVSGKPTAEQLVAHLNSQAAMMESIEARDLSISVRAQGSSAHLESGTLLCQKPRYMKLVGKKVGMQQVVVGSNSERFWFYVDRDPSNALFHCSYTDYEKGVELPFPFQPEWVLDALGMSPVANPDSVRMKEDRTTYKLIEDATIRGQKATKVTVFHKGDATGAQPQIASRVVYDANDRVIFVATISKVHRIPAGRGSSKIVAVPEVIQLEWPAQNTWLELDLGHAKVNTELSMEAFQMPRLGSKQVDLGRDRPTGRGVMPSLFR